MYVPQFNTYSHSKCFLQSLIIRPKLRKIESATNDPNMTLNATRPKIRHIYLTTVHESQILVRFALRWLILQIIEVFGFSIGYKGEFEIFEKKKKLKIGNSKISKITNEVL